MRWSREQKSRAAPVGPSALLRAGQADAVVVLVLWALRRAFWPVLLIGTSVALAADRLDAESLDELATPADLLGLLLTPLAGIAAALILRLGVSWLALLAAWPLSRWGDDDAPATRWSAYRGWVDRWRLAQAYRSLRWTWAVRDEAIERAGVLGRRLALAVPISSVATVLAVIGFLVMVSELEPP